ncbi:MAG: TRAP transporter small permease [Deltaproteobacteria bacterium]|nr:TRAP transporter small permease [Deltaproteobacteria bacterium]
MNHLCKKMEEGLRYFCLALLGMSVSLLVIIIILRAVFGIGYDFLTDMVVWLTIWSTMLYIGPLYGEGEHISVAFILRKLRGKIKMGVELFNDLVALFYVGTVMIGGCIAVYNYYVTHQNYARYIAIPVWIVQLCIPVGFGLFLIYLIIDLRRVLRGRKSSN